MNDRPTLTLYSQDPNRLMLENERLRAELKLEGERRQAAADKAQALEAALAAARARLANVELKHGHLTEVNENLLAKLTVVSSQQGIIEGLREQLRVAVGVQHMLRDENGAIRAKLQEAERQVVRLKGDLAQLSSAAPDSLLKDLGDMLPYSCWIGSQQDVATKVGTALVQSGRFSRVHPQKYDRASGNLYFICTLKPIGNYRATVFMVGCNLRKRRIWAAVHEPGRDL
jgi:regulator of replication initiation timing